MTKSDDELKTLRAAVRSVAHELSVWSADVLADGAFYGSHEDLAARLSALAANLMDALERHRDEPGLLAT
jgi:hypothetical protein